MFENLYPPLCFSFFKEVVILSVPSFTFTRVFSVSVSVPPSLFPKVGSSFVAAAVVCVVIGALRVGFWRSGVAGRRVFVASLCGGSFCCQPTSFQSFAGISESICVSKSMKSGS